MIARRVDHVSFAVRDLERSLAFYRDLLGLPLAPRPDLGFPGAWLQADAPLLSMLLGLASAITAYLGIDAHRNKDRLRLLAAISYGRRDSQLCSMELGRGAGLSE